VRREAERGRHGEEMSSEGARAAEGHPRGRKIGRAEESAFCRRCISVTRRSRGSSRLSDSESPYVLRRQTDEGPVMLKVPIVALYAVLQSLGSSPLCGRRIMRLDPDGRRARTLSSC
jgi:hypothetical protein